MREAIILTAHARRFIQEKVLGMSKISHSLSGCRRYIDKFRELHYGGKSQIRGSLIDISHNQIGVRPNLIDIQVELKFHTQNGEQIHSISIQRSDFLLFLLLLTSIHSINKTKSMDNSGKLLVTPRNDGGRITVSKSTYQQKPKEPLTHTPNTALQPVNQDGEIEVSL